MSIYSVNNWSSATTYSIHDIVKYNNYYYYSSKNNNLNNTPSTISTFWGGVNSYNGVTKPIFIWKPNYNGSINMEPRTKVIRYGDGYESRIPDGINNTLLNFEAIFDLRSQNESLAINHFLEKRKGTESFIFTLPAPFDLAKLFVCRNWTSTTVFYDNHSIRCRFEEVVN